MLDQISSLKKLIPTDSFMKKILICLCSVLLLAACSNEIPSEDPLPRKGRTILAYLVSNNQAGGDLDSYLKKNVLWMYESMSSLKDSCSLLLYYRPKAGDPYVTAPSILEFVSDGHGNINSMPALQGAELTEANVFQSAIVRKSYTDPGHNAVDPVIMAQVFKDMQKAVPSETYGLIFGSHATGWMEANQTVGRAFGDDNAYSINVPELAAVLQEGFGNGTLDFVLFDACMMGTAEVAYELRDVTHYCIASVMETPAGGFPYQRLFAYLTEDDIRFQELCAAFTGYYSSMTGGWGTCAVVDCTQMNDLATAVRNELLAFADSIPTLSFDDVQQYGAGSYHGFSYDVGDFFRVLNGGTIPTDFQEVLNRAVVAKDCVNGGFKEVRPDSDRFCGIGMYIPYYTSHDRWDAYYESSITWYDAVGWEAFRNK